MPTATAPVYPTASSSVVKQLKLRTKDLDPSQHADREYTPDFSSLWTISPSPSPPPTPVPILPPIPCSSVPPGPHTPPPRSCPAARSILRLRPIGDRGRKRLRVTFDLPEDYADLDLLEEVKDGKEWRKQFECEWEDGCGGEYEDTTAPTWGTTAMDVEEESESESEVESESDEEEEEEVVVYRNPPVRPLQANHGIDEGDVESDAESDSSMSLDETESEEPSSSSLTPTSSSSIYSTFSPVRQNYRYAPMVCYGYDLDDCMDVGNEYSSGDDSDSDFESGWSQHIPPTPTSPPSYDSSQAGAFCGPLNDLIHSDPASSSSIPSSESESGTPETGWSRSPMHTTAFDGHRDRGFTFNSSW